MSERARSFVQTWVEDILDGDSSMLGDGVRIDAMTAECLGEASFLGISREEIEAEVGDLRSFVAQKVVLAMASTEGAT